MPNALVASSSPYLRQHAGNPVDWVEWSQEALDRARAEDKPLLVSIGYAACHWCHVMAHESFENDEIAALMNEHFVCIKVDREERPDLDAIYMDACQILTGQGGWPLNAFATPDGKPFWAGTYFPPVARGGMHSWPAVLQTVADAWRERRDELVEQGQRLSAELLGAAELDPTGIPGAEVLGEAIETLGKRFDSLNGGFGGAPKFPPSTALALLLNHGGEAMARYTLRSMATGGIFDQLAGGFARYSVDAGWTVPHFEKMLYDNALLAQRYAEAAAGTDEPELARVAERTADWMIADLGDADGGFASSYDADSDGEEGTFYVWTPEQVRAALDGEDAEAAIEWFGVTEHGNFENGTTVLESRGEEPPAPQRDRIIDRLLEARLSRTPPARDGKRVVSWNALAIEALATTGIVLGRSDHLAAAERCADLILTRARDERGRLARLIPIGPDAAEGPAGVLDDHAHLLSALVALYEATFSARWLAAARELAGVLLRDFADSERGGFFSVAHDHEQLAARRKDIDDNPIPSGQASAATALRRLASLTGEQELREAAEGVLRLGGEVAQRHPNAFAQYLVALGRHHAPAREIAVVGDGPDADALIAAARAEAGPYAVIAAGPAGTDDVPLLAGRPLVDGKAAAYVCEHFTCSAPVTTTRDLTALLRS